METSTLLLAPSWAEQTFGSVRLGHQRRTERAVAMAAAIAANAGASLPKQMGSEAGLHAAYRVLQTPGVSYEQLIGPHLAQTREAMGQPERVLLIQDTTEVDYQQHPTTTGLGPIGNGTHHGFLLQTVLAVEPASRQVLGIAHQEPFLRQPARHLGKPSASESSASGSRRCGNAVCRPLENPQRECNGSM